ncbi:WD40 repeat domain-containing protein [Aspergillus clavatus NRRL 1]|uniref:Small nucleolar ribonucleoprotein complex subunit, putative n=1 Tax=Aspergillus clavatus (strain ATCC 1007 / CBS 513.65 / DSM 816 / NCTC 3887 / NRRL 1 / QM 1276 / 107) TaxID=344612 RepID=A1C5Z2_ASPCL|nr:small nucleolar ribonucleoprotein complex subunit, putative [Aspergillus clavatus NRRL 1]EAW13813.1 small nucleolar ribonucleoprotein complex subunit, putative [Aspergillus clavatus NRRL 1]
MPNTAVKQKTSQKAKADSRSPFENGDISMPVDSNDDSDMDVDVKVKGVKEKKVREKDDAERKLERMLFGDDEGFVGALKSHQSRDLVAFGEESDVESASEGEEEEAEDSDLAGVSDADLFFLDSGSAPVSTDLAEPSESGSDSEDSEAEGTLPALWHDSDDERLTVSLASHQRLRKLRNTESEDIISGKEYVKRLRRQFLQLHPVPDWANPELNNKQEGNDSDSDRDSDMDTDEENERLSTQPLAKLLQNASELTKLDDGTRPGGKRKLRQEVIDIHRLKDIGKDQPSSVDSLMFHPHYPLLLSSGPAATLFIHHISPSAAAPNPLLTSLHIRRTPIHTSAFALPSGNKIFASGRRRYFHIWDLDTGKVEKVNGTADRKEEQKSMERFKLSPCGRYVGLVGSSRKGGGIINILDSSTGQWIAQVRVDGRGGVADFAWWGDGEGMTVASKSGEVSEWDGRLNRVVARWMDAGAVGTTTLNLGGRSGRTQLGGDRWVAVGSSSGVVNVYDRREWAAAYAAQSNSTDAKTASPIPRNPEPVRALDQLTTPISHLVFAPDGQFLVMASRWKRDALRLVHLPTCTVFRNWPTSNTPFGRISSVAVSPNSDQLAVANEQGRIRLWEIRG